MVFYRGNNFTLLLSQLQQFIKIIFHLLYIISPVFTVIINHRWNEWKIAKCVAIYYYVKWTCLYRLFEVALAKIRRLRSEKYWVIYLISPTTIIGIAEHNLISVSVCLLKQSALELEHLACRMTLSSWRTIYWRVCNSQHSVSGKQHGQREVRRTRRSGNGRQRRHRRRNRAGVAQGGPGRRRAGPEGGQSWGEDSTLQRQHTRLLHYP